MRTPGLMLWCVALFVGAVLPLTAQSEPRWELVRLKSIGSAGSADPYLFSHIDGTHPAASGELVVADVRQRVVRVFDPSGAFTHTIGRAGGGPGEFQVISATGLVGDTVWLIDGRLRRTS